MTDLTQKEIMIQANSFFLLAVEMKRFKHAGQYCSVMLRYFLNARTEQRTPHLSLHQQNPEVMKL